MFGFEIAGATEVDGFCRDWEMVDANMNNASFTGGRLFQKERKIDNGKQLSLLVNHEKREIGCPSPPRVRCPARVVRFAKRGHERGRVLKADSQLSQEFFIFAFLYVSGW